MPSTLVAAGPRTLTLFVRLLLRCLTALVVPRGVVVFLPAVAPLVVGAIAVLTTMHWHEPTSFFGPAGTRLDPRRNRFQEAGKHGGEAKKPYEDWTKEELYDKAEDVGIEGRSKMDKKELISALRNH